MKYWKALSICVVTAALLVAVGLSLHVIRPPVGQATAQLPCDQLSGRAAVVDALAKHDDLAKRLKAAGSGVSVSVATPCTNEPDRALIVIKYKANAEESSVNEIMKNDGFGVPAELVKA